MNKLWAHHFVIEKPTDRKLKPYGYVEKPNNPSQNNQVQGMTLKEAYASPKLYLLYLGIMLISCAIAFTQHIPVYLKLQGASTESLGISMSILMLSIVIVKLVQGYMYDSLGCNITLFISSILTIIGFAIFSQNTILILFFCAVAIFAFGADMPTVLAPLMTNDIFGDKDYTAIYGIVCT